MNWDVVTGHTEVKPVLHKNNLIGKWSLAGVMEKKTFQGPLKGVVESLKTSKEAKLN